MDMDKYQYEASLTALSSARTFEYLIPGLAAEAGEVAGVYAKYIRDRTAYQKLREDMTKEMGDTLWFLALICEELNIDLSLVAQANLKKLNSRKERGTLGGSGNDR